VNDLNQSFQAIRVALLKGATDSPIDRYHTLIDTVDALVAKFADRPEYAREVDALLGVRTALLTLLRAQVLATAKDPTKWN
jgi:hypothetical protein